MHKLSTIEYDYGTHDLHFALILALEKYVYSLPVHGPETPSVLKWSRKEQLLDMNFEGSQV